VIELDPTWSDLAVAFRAAAAAEGRLEERRQALRRRLEALEARRPAVLEELERIERALQDMGDPKEWPARFPEWRARREEIERQFEAKRRRVERLAAEERAVAYGLTAIYYTVILCPVWASCLFFVWILDAPVETKLALGALVVLSFGLLLRRLGRSTEAEDLRAMRLRTLEQERRQELERALQDLPEAVRRQLEALRRARKDLKRRRDDLREVISGLPGLRRSLEAPLGVVRRFMEGIGRPVDPGADGWMGALADILPDDHLLLRRLVLGPGLEADAVVIGPGGVWVLEDGWRSGPIRRRAGRWERWRGGAWEPIPADAAPDRRWLQKAQAVRDRLRELPEAARHVRGGVVLAHPPTHLDAEGLLAECRTAEEWAHRIRASEPVPDLAEVIGRLQAADRLLEGHRQALSLPARSAREWARSLVREAGEELRITRELLASMERTLRTPSRAPSGRSLEDLEDLEDDEEAD